MGHYVTYGREAKRVDFNTKGGHVLLLEFTSQVTLDESGLYHRGQHNRLHGRLDQKRGKTAQPAGLHW